MKLYNKALTLLALLVAMNGFSQTIDVRAEGGIDCVDNKFYLSIKVQSADVPSLNLGNSSVYFTYNDAALEFDAITSPNFDGTDVCAGGANAWEPFTYDASEVGIINFTSLLVEGNEAFSCPDVTNTDWTVVAVASFFVYEIPNNGDITFEVELTNFNKNIPNDGVNPYTKGEFEVIINNCQGDFDNDGILDGLDNCPTVYNPNQEDSDNDNIGDVCDDTCAGLTAVAGPDRLVCEGDMPVLLASGVGGNPPYNYEWSTGDVSSTLMVDALVDTSFMVTVTDNLGCSSIDTVNIDYTTQYLDSVYFYSIDSSALITPLVDGGEYYINDFDDLWTIEVFMSGNVSCQDFVVYYQGEWIDDDLENGAPWRYRGDNVPAGLDPGYYSILVRTYSENNRLGVNCVQEYFNITLLDEDCPIAYAGEDQSACPGENVALSVFAEGGTPPYSYFWSDSSITANISVSSIVSTTYEVTVTDANGCSFTDEVLVEATPNAPNCDIDGDGLINLMDICPYTLPGAVIDGDGCTDADGDGAHPDLPLTDSAYDPDDADICYPGDIIVGLQLAAFLEGPLRSTTDISQILPTMRTDLGANGRGVLPGLTSMSGTTTPSGQPYNGPPWNYFGTEGANWNIYDYEAIETRTGKGVVDWVLISFRSTAEASSEFQKVAALLLDDGSVEFVDNCVITTLDPSEMYILVEHRNHMGIMTANKIVVESQEIIYDFTTQNSFVGSNSVGTGQLELSPGVWALPTGDASQISDIMGDINAIDGMILNAQNGVFDQYTLGDFNLDGDANSADRILWTYNNGLYSRVPR